MAHNILSPSQADDAVYDVSRFNGFTVYEMTAPGAGTPKVQLSPDGSTWFDAASFTSGIAVVTAIGVKARVHGGSGTPGAYLIVGQYAHDGG